MNKSVLWGISAFVVLTMPAFAADDTCPLKARMDRQVAAAVPLPHQTRNNPILVSVPPSGNQPLSSPAHVVDLTETNGSASVRVEPPVKPVPSPPNMAEAGPTLFPVAGNTAPESQTMATTVSPLDPSARYDAMLKAHLSDGPDGLRLFNYRQAVDAGALTVISDYVDDQSRLDPDVMEPAQAVVYWANLYNALTLKVVLENYPVSSIREIKSGFRSGPWKRDAVTINGEVLSLDNIEHDILRVKYNSPYIHYMVNCASIGCPNLKSELWRVDTLEADQKAAARDYINSPRGVRVNSNRLTLSSIYKWFKKDFGGKSGRLDHIRLYAAPDLAALIDNGAKIDGFDYDWSLNE